MTITGLENNYYLSGNDIWVGVGTFTEPVSVLEVTAKNLTTGVLLPPFMPSPSPTNVFSFNISQIIRALFPEPNHLSNNNLQNFQIDFKAIFTAEETPDEVQSLIKLFVRGGRSKNINDEWYLTSGTELIVGKWILWQGVTLPGNPQRLSGGAIISTTTTNTYTILRTNCNPVIVKFLNSLGGYQYFFFERIEIKTKSNSGKIIDKTTTRLRQDNFRQIENESVTGYELFTKTPEEIQSVFTDLVKSLEVFIYNQTGEDNDAKWQRVILEDNDAVWNNYDRVFANSLSVRLPINTTVKL